MIDRRSDSEGKADPSSASSESREEADESDDAPITKTSFEEKNFKAKITNVSIM